MSLLLIDELSVNDYWVRWIPEDQKWEFSVDLGVSWHRLIENPRLETIEGVPSNDPGSLGTDRGLIFFDGTKWKAREGPDDVFDLRFDQSSILSRLAALEAHFPPPGKFTGTFNSFWTLSSLLDFYNLNNLTNVGSATFVAGKVGNAVNLNGSSQYLTAPDALSLRGSGTFSISAWVNPTSFVAAAPIVEKLNATGAGEYDLRVDSSGKVVFYLWSGGANQFNLTSLGSLNLGVWNHVVATYDSGPKICSIYINGTLDTTGVNGGSTPVGTTQIFAIGAFNDGGYFFPGKIDALGFSQTLFSLNDVKNLYNTNLGLEPPF